MSATEVRQFRISHNMIHHAIFSQAGSRSKALAELVMNSQDAGASRFELTIDNTGFNAVDNGRGFQNRQEIENWFEELGFSHDSELHQEEGRFSRFGLGRAQCMAFASTQWLTNSFVMSVDIKGQGLSYELKERQPTVHGCKVEGQWYEPLSFADLKTTVSELEELIAYIGITVTINGHAVNKRNVKWDFETDQVFVRRREHGDLQVYNQGVLVRSYPGYQYGAGLVVSKVPFTLNMARNDILQSTCQVWKEVRTLLKDDAIKRTQRKKRLNDNERALLIDQVRSLELKLDEVADCPLLEDVTGRRWRVSKLSMQPYTVHTKNISKVAAERVHLSKQAFVLSKKTLTDFGFDSVEDLTEFLANFFMMGGQNPPKHIPIDTLTHSNNCGRVIKFNTKLLLSI